MNSVILSGNVCADAQTRQATTGNLYSFFNLAVNEKDRTDFISTSIWGKNTEKFAELLGKIKKGTKLLIHGKLRSREQMIGEKKITTMTVEIKEIEFLNQKTVVSGMAEKTSTPHPGNEIGQLPSYAPKEENHQTFGGAPVDDDDIPF